LPYQIPKTPITWLISYPSQNNSVRKSPCSHPVVISRFLNCLHKIYAFYNPEFFRCRSCPILSFAPQPCCYLEYKVRLTSNSKHTHTHKNFPKIDQLVKIWSRLVAWWVLKPACGLRTFRGWKDSNQWWKSCSWPARCGSRHSPEWFVQPLVNIILIHWRY